MGKLFLKIDVILVGEELVEPRLLKVDGGPDGKGDAGVQRHRNDYI